MAITLSSGDFFVGVVDTPKSHGRSPIDLPHRYPNRTRQISSPATAGGIVFAQQQQERNDVVTARERQLSGGSAASGSGRHKQLSGNSNGGADFFRGVIRRKQVSLDLLGPNDFFATQEDLTLLAPSELAPVKDDDEEEIGGDETKEHLAQAEKPIKLFRPLVFKPRLYLVRGGPNSGRHSAPHGDGAAESAQKPSFYEAEVEKTLANMGETNDALQAKIKEMEAFVHEGQLSIEDRTELLQYSGTILVHSQSLRDDEKMIGKKLDQSMMTALIEGSEEKEGEEQSDMIIKATRHDKIKGLICFLIMMVLTVVMVAWKTHLDEESFLRDPVGIACMTYCPGDVESRDFFHGHSSLAKNDVIAMVVHIDAYESDDHSLRLIAEIVGANSGKIKTAVEFGPVSHHERITIKKEVVADFEDPSEPHIINVASSNSSHEMTFTLDVKVLSPLANYSEVIAGLIMVLVYLLILLEVIHRTLVAIIGSMLALLFYYIMNNGDTEHISQIMLHLEWSTLGLLFGMMLLVGELSHTGIFEWCSVRLLIASNGSFNRLMVLLCGLTALSSAFLDNVTTMLLVAPVTIDMCNILNIDPRPYLIGEVILSNIGGTATLIGERFRSLRSSNYYLGKTHLSTFLFYGETMNPGDPPNIIIGSSFDDIGFVDFINHIMPIILLACVPAATAMICWIYRYYLTSKKMIELDSEKLKRAYPIYDEPRLLISGTVTAFVILLFFLHPVHHKDTAWIALVGAFVTISFTNPHDVQDALRHHVEWDTLLFFAGLFVLVEVCAAMGLLEVIGNALASLIQSQDETKQLPVAICLIIWVSAITSAFLDNIPYTATMIPIIKILSSKLPDTLPITTLAWALSLGACLGGNGTLIGASANIVTVGISANKGFEITFLNFFYPGMVVMIVTVAISNIYLLVRYVWL